MRAMLSCGLAALILAAPILQGCATAPRDTVAGLNTRAPEYKSRDCRAARAEAAKFDEQRNGRMVTALAANFVLPFAGTAAAAAMAKIKDDSKRDLNRRVMRACTSDPLGRGRVARR